MSKYEMKDGHLVKPMDVKVGDKTIRVEVHSARCPDPGCKRFHRISKEVNGTVNAIIGTGKKA